LLQLIAYLASGCGDHITATLVGIVQVGVVDQWWITQIKSSQSDLLKEEKQRSSAKHLISFLPSSSASQCARQQRKSLLSNHAMHLFSKSEF